MIKKILPFLFLGFYLGLHAQKKAFTEYNTFIENLNATVDYINGEQQKLQQYHQDFFRYYKIFDSLTVHPYEPRISNRDSTIKVPLISEIPYHQLNENLNRFDSIISQIKFENDLDYSSEKIDSMNARVQLISKLSNEMQFNIDEIEKSFTSSEFKNRKKAHQLMLKELEKVEFLVKKFKRRKLELQELNYYIPEKMRKQLPSPYLSILEEFENRLKECKEGKNKEEMIHYFLPEKYFDKWILKKYSLRYWQVKYLEDLIINPKFEYGLKSNYNTKVEDYALQKIRSINDFESLPFEYIPPSKSPLGRHQKVFVVLILDISNSMNESGKLEELKTAVKSFVDALRPQDKFSIILFSNVSQELVLPGEKDTEYIKYLVDKINAYGNTLPESAIFRAYNIMNLQTNKGYDNEIILITDGVFEVTGKMKYHINLGKKKDIVFSILNIESGGENYKELKKLTQISEGKLYFIPETAMYDTIIEEILR